MSLLPDLLVPLLFFAGLFVALQFFATQRRQESLALSGTTAGCSLAAIVISLCSAFFPGEAYTLGLRIIVPTIGIWLLVPLLGYNILPGIANQKLGSPFKYLQLRYNEQIAQWAAAAYLIGRTCIAAFALALMARMLACSLNYVIPSPVFVFVFGGLGFLSSWWSEKSAIVWLSCWGLVFLILGSILGIVLMLQSLHGDDQLWKVANMLERTQLFEPLAARTSAGNFWIASAAAFVTFATFFVADEACFQVLSQTRSEISKTAAMLVCLMIVTGWLCLQSYTGMGLSTFYFEHAQQVKPLWVVNVDRASRLSMTDPKTRKRHLVDRHGTPQSSLLTGYEKLDPTDGTILLDWNNSAHDLNESNAAQLIQQGRILDLNRNQPFTHVEPILQENNGKIDPLKLANVYTHHNTINPQQRELILHRRATEEIWPYFFAQQGTPGLRGVVFAALCAALWSVVTSSLQAVAAVTPYVTQEPTSPRLAQSVCLGFLLFLAFTICLFVDFPGEWMLLFFATTLVPIAAIIFLGLTNRYATPNIAGIAFFSGVLWTFAFGFMVIVYGKRSDAILWAFHPICSIIFGMVATSFVGHLCCFMLGKPYRRGELEGLLLGRSSIGYLRPEEASMELEIDEPEPPTERWRSE